MSGAGAILYLSTIPHLQPRSPLSRSAGEGPGVRVPRTAGEGPGVRVPRTAGEGTGVRVPRTAGEGTGVRAAPRSPSSPRVVIMSNNYSSCRAS